ncbi:MAG: hypothetical protein R2867_05175 [Caldilineaceae bacterium]
MADLLSDVATSFSGQAEAKGIALKVTIDTTTPLPIQGDPGRLDQVLSNLVANALQHTPENGTVTLTARRTQNRLPSPLRIPARALPKPIYPLSLIAFGKLIERVHMGRGSAVDWDWQLRASWSRPTVARLWSKAP